MKKILLLSLSVAALVACNKSEDLAEVATPVSTETSSSVSSYVAQNYPDTKVISTTSTGATVTTVLNTGETLTFTQDGTPIAYANNFNAGAKADSLGLPCDSTHHDGRGPGKPGKGGKGHGGDKPDSTQVGGKPGKHGHDLHFKNEISVDSLPTAINTYISTNFSGYSVIHAEKDTICQGAVTEVMVCSVTKEPVKLIFDSSDNFMMKASRIEYSTVPSAVSAAVSANYASYTVMKRAEEFTLANGNLQYKVFMQLDKTLKSVTFNADGSIACEK